MKNAAKYTLSLKQYKAFFNLLYTPLCLFSNKYIEDLDTSKDIVQDVFIKIWEDKIEFQNENNIKSYLYTSVKNKSIDYLQTKQYRLKDRLSIQNLEKLESEDFFSREVVIIETSIIIERAINTLPNKCANIIRLSFKNLSNIEIAMELGISLNTVKTQKKIGYKRLKPLLKDYVALVAFLFGVGTH
ncbi:RNA polymerase sigma-70 factor [Arenibacter sp. F26102]|uniref:RNA polymerase sigma-70 factor n=1 Tax=Arenibacter sp. F26102 TaxID=2926416 RepID=UPI001FF2CD2D|nr:RNA polymerase sigma-70 factor [Arenibacter sp. F26102]